MQRKKPYQNQIKKLTLHVKNKIATRSHVFSAAAEKWECNVLQGTCKFGGKICQIKMAEWHDQLYMVANNPTKFQQNRFSGF